MIILLVLESFVKVWTDKMFLWARGLTWLVPCSILSESTKPGRFPVLIMLTGFDLLNKVNNLRNQGYTTKDIAVYCGYGRPGRGPQYAMFYQNLIRAKASKAAMDVRKAERNNYANLRQKEVCDAVFHAEEYNKNNDKVLVTRTKNQFADCRTTSYFFCDELLVNLIFGDGPVYAILHLPSKKSKTAKSRINAILRRTFGYSLFQKKGEWYIARPFHNDEVYTNGMRIEYPEI